MTRLNLYLSAKGDSSLRQCVQSGSTGFWRISDETLAEVDRITIWAEPEQSSCESSGIVAYSATMTDWTDTDWINGRARIIHFATRTSRLQLGLTPPKFNRMGWVITEDK